MPEVGLNGLLLDYPYSGTAVYTRQLAPLLPTAAPEFRFRLFVRRAPDRPHGVAVERLTTPIMRLNGRTRLAARLDKLAWEEIAFPAAAAARREVLIHSLYLSAPLIAHCPVVVTVHDLIRLALPDYHRTRQSQLYNELMVRAVKQVAAIVTVSNHSRQDIVRLLRVPEERVHVTYEAAGEHFSPHGRPEEGIYLRARYGLPDRFLLYLGGAERRKNIETLIRAWALVARGMRDRETKLVVVANFPPPDRLYPDIPGLAHALGLERDVVFVRDVAEEDKPALYRAATALCFPSVYEGFGFSPLEAMASGLPVIASDASSIPEVVGEAGLLLPPTDLHAWSSAMLEVVDSESTRDRLRRQGLERAGRFSWRLTAQQTADVYRGVLGR